MFSLYVTYRLFPTPPHITVISYSTSPYCLALTVPFRISSDTTFIQLRLYYSFFFSQNSDINLKSNFFQNHRATNTFLFQTQFISSANFVSFNFRFSQSKLLAHRQHSEIEE